ncbi:Tol-Pal system beta propeller repeat protein TolB [Aestuariivirga sp.]|uniref:Tol-Pal system beta propeller repeat protein TolB n=1 Tax=Aestuariivirga sp. TaxID=2650926 RepID=UPI0039E46317
MGMMLNRRKLITAVGAAPFAALAARSPAMALEVDVSGGKINPLPIAIAPFLAGSGSEDVSAEVAGVIANNLGRSGYFSPLPPDSFIERISDFEAQPNMASWRQVQAQALVTGQAYMDGGKLRVSFKLYDVNSGQLLASQSLAAGPKLSRRLAHRISDQIYEALTGFDGYFDTRIVYIDESGPKSARIKKLAIMDQDGFNARELPVQGDLLLTPRFSPTANEVTFLSFGTGEPRVYIYNIDTNQKEIVGDFPNMSFAPRFSPDGVRVIMSLQSDDGVNSNLFEMNLQSRQLQQITNVAAINTAPCYSPDGSSIAFESDRGGNQQIYVMSAGGGEAQRITFGKGRYSTPVWSPDGKWIAFTKNANGKFAIGVMKPDGSGERILTEGFHNEGPTWAPNSRVIMFFRESGGESGGPHLFSVDVTGYNEQQVPTPEFSSDPAWSPKLN